MNVRLKSPCGQYIRLVNPTDTSLEWFYGRGYKDEDEEVVRTSRSAICEKNPWVSTAAAVHKDQVGKFNRDLKAAGIKSAHYDPSNGNLVCTSRGARKRVLQMRGMVDRDGGYGD